MKNEELLVLGGGYDPTNCCMCYDGTTCLGAMGGSFNQQECNDNCYFNFYPEYEYPFGRYSC
jgi:hypothetical protein